MHRSLFALCFLLPAPALADGHDALIAAQEAWEAAINGDDPAATAQFFMPDARLFPQDGPMVEGLDNIVDFWSGLISGPAQIDLQMVDVDLFGDVAVENGTYALTLPNEEGGESTFTGKTLVVWVRDGDGDWKMLRDMWNDGT